MVIVFDALHPKPFWREGCVTAAAVATWPRVASKALWGRPVDERHTVGLASEAVLAGRLCNGSSSGNVAKRRFQGLVGKASG